MPPHRRGRPSDAVSGGLASDHLLARYRGVRRRVAALAGLVVRALQVEAWSGAAFIAAFLAFFLWQAGNFFRRNQPGMFRPDAVPEAVLPRRR